MELLTQEEKKHHQKKDRVDLIDCHQDQGKLLTSSLQIEKY